MKKILSLFLKFRAEILYIIFGLLTTLVNIASYFLFYSILNFENVTSAVIAWVISVVFAYITNRIFVFESKTTGVRAIIREAAAFFACRFLTGVADVIIMFVAVDVMKWNSLLWKLISNIFVIVANYLASALLIFKKKK